MNRDFQTRFSPAIKCDVCPVNFCVTLKVPTIIGQCFQYSKGSKHSYISLPELYNVTAAATELCIIMCGFHVKNESRL